MDRKLKMFFDDKEIPLHHLVKREDVLMAYQERMAYGTNEDECGFTYIVDIDNCDIGEHLIVAQLIDSKDNIISQKDLKVNIV